MSTCTAERSFSGMKRLQTPLRRTMTDERLSSLAILPIHKNKDVTDIDGIIAEFANLKGSTHLTLCLYCLLLRKFPIFKQADSRSFHRKLLRSSTFGSNERPPCSFLIRCQVWLVVRRHMKQFPDSSKYFHCCILKRQKVLNHRIKLQNGYPSKRIIRRTDNSSKYKSEDEFCSIICQDILSRNYRGKKETL